MSVPTLEAIQADQQPVLLPGLVADWPAVQLWRGPSGVAHLSRLCGATNVQCMLAKGQFVGDMQHLLLLGCQASEFFSGQLLRQIEEHAAAGGDGGGATTQRYSAYLAQCSIAAVPPGGGALAPGPLYALAADVPLPVLLVGQELSQINFWASITPTRSSCHYDPYENLLCIAAGSKTVRLLPPSATGTLCAQPVYHESANHCPVDLAAPDLDRFPSLAAALPALQTFTLRAGDALFIPEGWWHQVESSAGTLAVNHWWESRVGGGLGGPTDAFYLRRLAQSLQAREQEKQRALACMNQWDLGALLAAPEVVQQLALLEAQDPGWNAEGYMLSLPPSEDQEQMAHVGPRQQPAQALDARLEGSELAALGALIHRAEEHQRRGLTAPDDVLSPEVDALMASLAADGAESLMRVLLVMRRWRPAATAWLLMCVLAPRGWELLTAAGERQEASLAAAGQLRAEELCAAFFDQLYSAVDDRQALLDVILARKEQLARACLATVLRKALSVPALSLG